MYFCLSVDSRKIHGINEKQRDSFNPNLIGLKRLLEIFSPFLNKYVDADVSFSYLWSGCWVHQRVEGEGSWNICLGNKVRSELSQDEYEWMNKWMHYWIDTRMDRRMKASKFHQNQISTKTNCEWNRSVGWMKIEELKVNFVRDRLLADGICDKYNVPSVSSISR